MAPKINNARPSRRRGAAHDKTGIMQERLISTRQSMGLKWIRDGSPSVENERTKSLTRDKNVALAEWA